MNGKEGFSIKSGELNSYLYISKPVYGIGNQLAGVVFEVIKLTRLEDQINIQNALSSQSTFLFSNDMVILGNQSIYMPKDLSKKINIANGSGLINYKNSTGNSFILFWKNIPNLNLSIATQIDNNYILEQFKQDFTVIVITFLIIFITSLTISIIMVKKLEEPINFLQRLSQEIKDGNYKTRVEESFIVSSPKEFQPLLKLYNQMSISIESYISKLNEKTQELIKSEARFRAVVEDQTDLLCRFKEDGTITFSNEAFKNYLNLKESEKYNLFELLSEDAKNIKGLLETLDNENQYRSVELMFKREEIKKYFDWTFRIIYKEGSKEFQGTGHDISEIKKLEDELRYQSFHDNLTGLLNRAYFEEEFERLSSGRFSPTSIIVADIDNLKVINDHLGHDNGDLLLIKASKILQTNFRNTDIVARIGGDEFVILLPFCPLECVEELLRRLKNNVIVANKEADNLFLSISVGYANATGPFNKVDLFKEADTKMYLDKKSHHEKVKEIAIRRIKEFKKLNSER
jgi:diguanylate cyclase (GGDEF)-like protein/PAS domain S-box-containing protein